MQPNSRLEGALVRSAPFLRYEYVTVTFPSSPDTDIDIAHSLAPSNPDEVDYEVVRKDRAADIYNDTSGTRRAWGSNYITLRCTVASAVVQLRLSIRRT
jgi:hypothetical protein